jgi:hypothetical protein
MGIYGRSGDYDLRFVQNEANSKDVPAQSTRNYTGKYRDAGVSAGLTLRLFGGLGLEAGARAGYVHASPKKYLIDGNYCRFNSRLKYGKVEVTDLNISLTYQFKIDK